MTSLSSKLRDFRKGLRKGGKNKPGVVFDDDQLRSIARHMPKDPDSLGRFLLSAQMDAYGDDMLRIMQAHSRDQTKFEDCILEIGAFVRGGLPGMECLNKVYLQILEHFDVQVDMEEVFEELKLYVNLKRNRIMCKWAKDEEEDEIGGSSQKKRMRLSQ
jgi:hypothetical protein